MGTCLPSHYAETSLFTESLQYTECSAVKPTNFASVFRSYSEQKISYKLWVDSALLSLYGPKLLFALFMVLLTKKPIMIATAMIQEEK
jgi:hypothetical protein